MLLAYDNCVPGVNPAATCQLAPYYMSMTHCFGCEGAYRKL